MVTTAIVEFLDRIADEANENGGIYIQYYMRLLAACTAICVIVATIDLIA